MVHHSVIQALPKNNEDDDMIRRIFTDDLPLLDVRAEVEFAKGAFPNSVNIPLLDDEQRRLVGTCYKEEGPKAAFDLGVELITPFKDQRIAAWKRFSEANPTGYLYCFRGGSRSQISQAGLKEAGVDYPLVDGGYKRMRQFLIDELEMVTFANRHDWRKDWQVYFLLCSQILSIFLPIYTNTFAFICIFRVPVARRTY